MWRLISILLALLGTVLLAIAWSGAAVPKKADFTFINRGDHKTLDPNSMSWLQDIRIAYALWEGLYTLDETTLEPIAGTADRVSISSDQRVYTFHIRTNALWSDSKADKSDPVVADDFIFAWRRMLEQPAEYVELLFYIQGAKAYQEAYAAWAKAQPDDAPPTQAPPDFSMVGVEKLGPQELRVTLSHPLPFFPALCAFPPFFPQNQRSMARFAQYANDDPRTGRIVAYDQRFTRPPYLVSNGPYVLSDWAFQRRLRLEASPYYWDRQNVKSKIIDELVIEDPMGALRAYLEGRVDWVADVLGDQGGAELLMRKAPDLHTFPGFGTYFYSFNCQPQLSDGRDNPFHDVRVRQAFAMSIDKTPIVQNVTRMGEETATHYIPPGIFPDYPSPEGQAYDLAAARRLLAEAGYPDGRGFPHLAILFNNEGQHADIAQSIHRQWQENLGIDLSIEGVELSTFAQHLHNKEYAVARASWIGDYNDPSTFTDKYRCDSENNDSGWINPEYDRLCEQAVCNTDARERLRLFAQAEAILLREAPIMPVYHYRNAYLFRNNVHGIALDPRNMVMFKSIEVVNNVETRSASGAAK